MPNPADNLTQKAFIALNEAKSVQMRLILKMQKKSRLFWVKVHPLVIWRFYLTTTQVLLFHPLR
jgi:hypothetical protein